MARVEIFAVSTPVKLIGTRWNSPGGGGWLSFGLAWWSPKTTRPRQMCSPKLSPEIGLTSPPTPAGSNSTRTSRDRSHPTSRANSNPTARETRSRSIRDSSYPTARMRTRSRRRLEYSNSSQNEKHDGNASSVHGASGYSRPAHGNLSAWFTEVQLNACRIARGWIGRFRALVTRDMCCGGLALHHCGAEKHHPLTSDHPVE
jgi:hypothetical protein